MNFDYNSVLRRLEGFSPDKLVVPVTLLVVILLAYGLARFTWMLVPSPEGAAGLAPGGVGEVAPTRVAKPAFNAREITNWHLFGQASEQNVSSAPPEDAPETSLRLVLRGVIASTEPDQARAIVADPAGKEDHYAVGSQLPGRATLTAIHTDRIILKRNGRHETLRLLRDELGDSPSRRTGQATSADTRRLRSLRDTLVRNPVQLATRFRPEPVAEGGKVIGYRINPRSDQALIKRMGLRAGDVISSVNGLSLANSGNLGKVLNSVRTASSIQLTLMRNGQIQEISVSLR